MGFPELSRLALEVSVVLPVRVILITPLCVPLLMAANAPASVGYVALVVPVVAETDTCEKAVV